MEVRREFISVGCNRHPGALRWATHAVLEDPDKEPTRVLSDGIVAYAAHNMLALYNPLGEYTKWSVQKTLLAHTAPITAFDFLYAPQVAEPVGIVSGDTEGNLVLWRRQPSPDPFNYEIAARMEMNLADKRSISAISGLDPRFGLHASPVSHVALFAAASSNGQVSLFRVDISDDGAWTVMAVRRFSSGRHFIMSLALTLCPYSQGVWMASGGSSRHIELHYAPLDDDLLSATEALPWSPALTLAGHEDWIRGLDWKQSDDPTQGLFLASCSQDKLARVWHIRPVSSDPKARPLGIKAPYRLTDDVTLECDTLGYLMGHDQWIYSVRWRPGPGPLACVTASSDGKMMLWEGLCDPSSPSPPSFVNVATVGDCQDTFGYYDAVVDVGAKIILGHGHTGSLVLWRHHDGGDETGWQPEPGLTGHVGPVRAVSWSPPSRVAQEMGAAAGAGLPLFATCGQDSTTRLFAQCARFGSGTWKEIARPQIHGYEMQAVSFLPNAPFSFASAGDEKVVRVFEAPKTFVRLLYRLMTETKVNGTEGKSDDDVPDWINEMASISFADVPALGLTNKPVEATHGDDVFQLDALPLENHLSRKTLWPEVDKLYGHPYEIYSLCGTSAPLGGALVVAGCKSTQSEFAQLREWLSPTPSEMTPTGQAHWTGPHHALQPSRHALTVTRLVPCPSDPNLLLSVSRDRAFALYGRSADAALFDSCLQVCQAAHDRIIWSAAWTPLSCTDGSLCFATVSRDKTCKVWRRAVGAAAFEWRATWTGAHGLTAILCLPGSTPLAATWIVGDEIGRLHVLSYADDTLSLLCTLPVDLSHNGAVTDLQCSLASFASRDRILVCSTGDDHAVRLFSLLL